MAEQDHGRSDVDQFLLDQVDTVPHLEALLLLWNSRPKTWSVGGLAKELFVTPDAAEEVLDDLVRRRLIVGVSGACETYHCEPEPDRDQLLASVDSTFRRELIRVSRLIHSKPSAAVHEFARAFRLKEEGD